jgi:hypothetical protein
VLAAQLFSAEPSLALSQIANDLFFAAPASLYRLSLQLENRLTKIRGPFSGAGQFHRDPFPLFLGGDKHIRSTRAKVPWRWNGRDESHSLRHQNRSNPFGNLDPHDCLFPLQNLTKQG